MIKKLFLLAILLLTNIPAFAQVDTAWVRRYNGPGNFEDWAYAIATDDSGNVYVTGFSEGSGTSPDYATIKYYPNGDTAWVRRYDGRANSSDMAYAIAIDDSGNVYVAGTDTWITRDYATIKYYPNGDTAWVRKYDGGYGDFAYAIAVDDSGNVFVTGSSDEIFWGSDDYATIKYYSNGDTAWVRIYNGPGNRGDVANAIAIDDSGNVYVTGNSAGSGLYVDVDYATIKYYSNGDTAWVRRYNGPGNISDYSKAIAVDGSGNVYVTGRSDDSSTSFDYATVKYYPNGDTAWVRRYSGPGNSGDLANALTLDNSGNVYVTGYSEGSTTDFDYATIKYYSNGDTAWVRRYNGPGNGGDVANAVAVDDSGNVYVTGFSEGSGYNIDYATIKYSSNGDAVWTSRYNGPGNSGDMAFDIAIDDSGNVCVTGNSEGSVYNADYATIKYVQSSSDVKDETCERERPSELALSQNYPNPFNSSTKIEFTLAKSGFVNMTIYNLLGRRVRTLVSEQVSSGYKSVFWDAKNEEGEEVTSGIYFYKIQAGDLTQVRKMVLLK
jgi:hypothetical protein